MIDIMSILQSGLNWGWVGVVVLSALAAKKVENLYKGASAKAILMLNAVLAIITYLALSLGLVSDTLSVNLGFPQDLLWGIPALILSIYFIQIAVLVIGRLVYDTIKKHVKG